MCINVENVARNAECAGLANSMAAHFTCEGVMSRMDESCHVWMSHVTREWVMSYMKESCHTCDLEVVGGVEGAIAAHFTCKWVMSRMDESCHLWMSHVTYEKVMSHMWPRSSWWNRGSHSGSALHMWMSHVMYGWIISPVNESCHIWTSRVTRMTSK